MIFKIIIIILLILTFFISCYFIEGKKKDKEEVEDNTSSGVVIRELVNTNSKLFKEVKSSMLAYIDDALLNGSSFDYNFFKAYLTESIINEIHDRIEMYGTDLIGNEFDVIGTRDNLDITIWAIMDMPELDSEIAKIYVDRITSNISDAENHERNAVEMHKEYDQAPGKDEELHPSIPNPEVVEEVDIDEMSIEALSSTGTVEDVK